jgi:hypothetical protein
MCVCTHRRSMSASFLDAMIAREEDLSDTQTLEDIEKWVKQNFWRWDKKSSLDPDDLGGSPESLDLSRFTLWALEFAFYNDLKFWQCEGSGEGGQVTIEDMKAMLKACTCDVCGYVEQTFSWPVCDCEGSCGQLICDDCRAVDEDESAVIDDTICQKCYDGDDDDDEDDEVLADDDEDETCARCEESFRYYLHDATCDDCSSYFVCKDCEMLMEGCGICGKIEE